MLSLILSPSGSVVGPQRGGTHRTVKYMGNKPAKNISSLESHTMVPTLTTFGRVSECTLLDWKPGAAAVEVTHALWTGHGPHMRPGSGVSRGPTRDRPTGFRAVVRGAVHPRIRSAP